MPSSGSPKRKKSRPAPDVLTELVRKEMRKELRRRARTVETEAELEQVANELLERLPAIMTETMDAAVEHQAADADLQMNEYLKRRRASLRHFGKRLATTWGQGFDRLEMLIDVFVGIGARYHDHQLRSKSTSHAAYAVVQLHARAARVAFEVLALLKAGFADGAMARARTLFEIAIVAVFLREHGDDTAERYLLHEAVSACKTAETLDAHAVELGWAPVDPEELRKLREARAHLVGKCGKVFGTEYGWAAAALHTDGAVGIAHLLPAIKQAKWRPFYRWASEGVHAGPGGLRPIGVEEHGRGLMLVGPTNAGLLDPAQLAVFALRLVGLALLRPDGHADSTVDLGAFHLLAGRCVDAFADAHEAVERLKERDRQREEREAKVRAKGRNNAR